MSEVITNNSIETKEKTVKDQNFQPRKSQYDCKNTFLQQSPQPKSGNF